MKMKLDTDQFSAKKSTIIYIIVGIVIVLAVLIGLIISRSKKEEESVTKGYNEVYEISDYAVKINSVSFLEDTNELAFVYYIKQIHNTSEAASAPFVSEIEVTYDEKNDKTESLVFSSERKNDIQILYTAKDFDPKNAEYITIYIEYKDADYRDKDIVDEFGDVTEGEFHKGETHTFYVTVDIRDIKNIKSSEFELPKMNTDEMEKATSISTKSPENSSQTDTSESIAETTTTTTVDDSGDTPAPPDMTTTSRKIVTVDPDSDTPAPPDMTTTSRRIIIVDPESDTPAPPDMTTTSRRIVTVDPNSDTPAPPDMTTSSRKIITVDPNSDTPAPPAMTTTARTTTQKITTTTKQTTTTKTTTTAKSIPTVKLAVDVSVEQLAIGNTLKINPVYEPINSTDTFSWSSNREDRVTVDSSGTVTAVGKGSAIITCTDDVNGLTASCMITAIE